MLSDRDAAFVSFTIAPIFGWNLLLSTSGCSRFPYPFNVFSFSNFLKVFLFTILALSCGTVLISIDGFSVVDLSR